MKALTWKSVLVTLHPSPVFEVMEIFAQELATRDNERRPKKIGGANEFGPPKVHGQMSAHAEHPGCRQNFERGE
jgi:hypothetical protein